MVNSSESTSPTVSQAQLRLQELALGLRKAQHLKPRQREALADLVEELSRDLPATGLPPEEVTRLTDCAAQLLETLHHEERARLLAAARDRLGKAVVRMEIAAPFTAGLLRRLIDALGSIGV
jgi:hypothetical protein